jgi:hypothetical protein
MNSEFENTVEAMDRKIPDALMQKLHGAHQRLHEARQSFDAAEEATKMWHQKQVDIATDQFRAAEHEVEEINAEIAESIAQVSVAQASTTEKKP